MAAPALICHCEEENELKKEKLGARKARGGGGGGAAERRLGKEEKEKADHRTNVRSRKNKARSIENKLKEEEEE